MGGLGESQAGFWDGFGPIALVTEEQRLFKQALLQVVQLVPRIGVLLDGGKKTPVELRVSRFDQVGKVTPVRLGPGVPDEEDKSCSDTQ